MAQVQEKIQELKPSVDLYGHDLTLPPIGMMTLFTWEKEATPDTIYEVTIKDLFHRFDKMVIFGIPGAYSPVCTTEHCPTFLQNINKFKAQGIDVACLSTNDAFVMGSFSKFLRLDKGIRMLCDPTGRFLESIGKLDTNPDRYFGRNVSTRFAMFVVNGRVRAVTEGDVEKSGALGILKAIEEVLTPSEKEEFDRNSKKTAIQAGMEKVMEKASDAYHGLVSGFNSKESDQEENRMAEVTGKGLGARAEEPLGLKQNYPYAK